MLRQKSYNLSYYYGIHKNPLGESNEFTSRDSGPGGLQCAELDKPMKYDTL